MFPWEYNIVLFHRCFYGLLETDGLYTRNQMKQHYSRSHCAGLWLAQKQAFPPCPSSSEKELPPYRRSCSCSVVLSILTSHWKWQPHGFFLCLWFGFVSQLNFFLVLLFYSCPESTRQENNFNTSDLSSLLFRWRLQNKIISGSNNLNEKTRQNSAHQLQGLWGPLPECHCALVPTERREAPEADPLWLHQGLQARQAQPPLGDRWERRWHLLSDNQ